MTEGTEPGEVVKLAARRSLAERGVRVYQADVAEAVGGWKEPWSWQVGVAVPADRTARVRIFHSPSSPVQKLYEVTVSRWPWLDDEAPGGSPSAPRPTRR